MRRDRGLSFDAPETMFQSTRPYEARQRSHNRMILKVKYHLKCVSIHAPVKARQGHCNLAHVILK